VRKSQLKETQILQILKEAKPTVKDICREHGVSHSTHYNLELKYNGMETWHTLRVIG